MRIIGAGFGRTGTASMQAALETLGFAPCYHMREVFPRPDHALLWERAARGERVDFETLFDGWQATVDWPACTFYRELTEIFPTAKVLLNVRDPERWYESCLNTIYPATAGRFADPRAAHPTPAPEGGENAETAARMINRLIWQGTFDGRFEDRAHAIDVFNRHIDEVTRTIPAERLLVYDVKHGWAPLCAFLDVPVPSDTPFPHLNDTASFQQRSRPQEEERSK
jgi:hypothetical protein